MKGTTNLCWKKINKVVCGVLDTFLTLAPDIYFLFLLFVCFASNMEAWLLRYIWGTGETCRSIENEREHEKVGANVLL